jgi:hypothetical protein
MEVRERERERCRCKNEGGEREGGKEINKIMEVKLIFNGIESYNDSLGVEIHC